MAGVELAPTQIQVLQVLTIVVFAPLISGAIARLEARLQGRRGPRVLQPYYDLAKLFRKETLVPEDAGWVFVAGPMVAFTCYLVVPLLIPVLTTFPLPLGYMGDILGGAFVLALAGFAVGLAAAETDGTIPTFSTPERIAQIRAQIGPDKLICVQQISMLEKDASKARTAIRGLIRFYLGLPNYLQSLRLMGFDDSDFAAGGSDRIVDAMVAWRDEQAIRDRIAAQYKAGATHVCITPLRPEGSAGAWSLAAGGKREHATPEERALEALAPR